MVKQKLKGRERKLAYGAKLCALVKSYKNILLVNGDNVGSSQMQQIRMALRGRATLLMGKNTTILRVLNDFLREEPEHPIRTLVEGGFIKGNCGFCFTNEDVASVRSTILSSTVPAPARSGTVAPSDVFVEPGRTGCDPGQTSWFQALGIATKINRGQIEIVSRVHIIKKGDRVGESEAALLQKLGINPFSYSLGCTTVWQEGEVFEAAILDITEEDMMGKLLSGARVIASLGLMVGYPTKASVTHSLNNAYKMLLSLGLGTDYKFGAVAEFEEFLANPANFAAAPTAGAGEAAPEVEEEESEEESAGGAGGLFDDDDDDW